MSNLLVFPNDPTNGAWTFNFGSMLTSLGFATAPDGSSDAFQMTDNDGGNVSVRGQPVAIPADSATYVVDVWVRKTGVVTNYPALDVRFGANNILVALVIDTRLGTITPRTGWNPDTSGIASWDADYWHVFLTKANAGYTSIMAGLEPAFNADASGTPDVGAGGPAVFWLPRVNLGTTPPPLLLGSPSQFMLCNP